MSDDLRKQALKDAQDALRRAWKVERDARREAGICLHCENPVGQKKNGKPATRCDRHMKIARNHARSHRKAS